MTISSSEVLLIALALKNNGNWDAIYEDIKNKSQVEDKWLEMAKNIKAMTILNEGYPQALKNIVKPPFVLFYKGDIALLNNVDNNIYITGTKTPTHTGKEATEHYTKNNDFQNIVIGCNHGTEEIAKLSALQSGKKIICVLNNGIDNVELSKENLIISEYPFDTPKTKETCMGYKRVCVGISKEMYVMEVRKQSGTMFAIDIALTCGKEVNVLPVQYGTQFANNELISDGANILL